MSLIKSISGVRGTIGGTVGENLTPVDIVKYASAYGSWIKEQSQNTKIVIGRDARISGEMVSNLVSNTLLALGLDVIDLGLSTTPTVEIAVPLENAAGGIILTASHNPIHWNALKLLNKLGECISEQENKKILEIADKEAFYFSDVKKIGKYNAKKGYINKHIDMILDMPIVNTDLIKEKRFKIIVDAVNSVGGIAVPKLLKNLGCEVTQLYCEPSGYFPHDPEPLPHNITQICSEIKQGSYDLGIVVDPDVDRLVFVCENGDPFGEEYTLVAVADYILDQKKGGNTVSNLSSTRALKDLTEKKRGSYFASAVGEVNVVKTMKENHAVIGGEGNGGVILPELHYGRDALAGIALFLSHLAITKMAASSLKASYPAYHISKNKIDLFPNINIDHILLSIKNKYAAHPINNMDGVKIELGKEWIHLRKSNTEPIIRIYAESSSQAAAEHLIQEIIDDIKKITSTKAP